MARFFDSSQQRAVHAELGETKYQFCNAIMKFQINCPDILHAHQHIQAKTCIWTLKNSYCDIMIY